MKKILFTITLITTTVVIVTAQSSNENNVQNKFGKEYAVYSFDDDKTIFTDEVSIESNGSVKVSLNSSVIMNGNLTEIAGNNEPSEIKLITGPAEKVSYESPMNGQTIHTKICYNTNRWPCMLVRGGNAQ